MPKHRTHTIAFKRQICQEFASGETLYGLAKRHGICRNLIRVWVAKFEAGEVDEDAEAASLISGLRGADRRARTAGRPSGSRAGVSKGGAEKHTVAEKRAYIREQRPQVSPS